MIFLKLEIPKKPHETLSLVLRIDSLISDTLQIFTDDTIAKYYRGSLG